MSVYTAKTGLSSILKPYTPNQHREKTKQALINKVKFKMPKEQSITGVVEAYQKNGKNDSLKNYISFLGQMELDDADFEKVINEATSILKDLTHESFTELVEALLNLKWLNRTPAAQQMFADFCVEILISESKFLFKFLHQLIGCWKPNETESDRWPIGTPDEDKQKELQAIHNLLDRILSVIPVSFNTVIKAIITTHPYHKRPTFVYAGFLHNLLWLLKYKPIFNESVFSVILERLIALDTSIQRSEIEDSDSDSESDNSDDETMFPMDDCKRYDNGTQRSSESNLLVETLDACLEKIFEFLETCNPHSMNMSEQQKRQTIEFSNTLFKIFDKEILRYYNTHHVQFIWFFYCSFKPVLAETFLSSLWHKIQNPNVPPILRQTAVGYLASFLARANFVSISVVQHFLKKLSVWAHNYIQNSDQCRSNCSLKANLIFYTICQAIFYVIAFRSRNLAENKKGLLFLQSLQLSGLVTCNLNPLRVCLPAVATAFAGVTRTYQLAYCHAILERNARRKLATIYGTEAETPDEVLDTFFPFDPYLLKNSKKRIEPFYLQYQASEAEEHTTPLASEIIKARKRGDSEMMDEADIDDFLIADKRQRLLSREAQFTYGLSPGFHM